MKTHIDRLNLTTRTSTNLKRANLVYIEDINSCSDKVLLEIKNFGINSLRELKDAITKYRVNEFLQ